MNDLIHQIEVDDIVVKFAGDSGDGMQLTGTLFADAAVKSGNDMATFPDYPAEIRAPHNTVAGVSGFQVRISKNKIQTPGDFCDFLVAMNPASLKANLKWLKKDATILIDSDAFDQKAFEKAGYTSNPLENDSLAGFHVLKVPISSLTKQVLSGSADNKQSEKSRNMFVLGMVLSLFGKKVDSTVEYIHKKFSKNRQVEESNVLVLKRGFEYAEAIHEKTFSIPAAKIEKGKYRNITGNIATAWGLLAASEKSGRPIFLGSYPITPATDIMIEIAKHKSLGAKVLQAEDEIAGICSAIGASFTGSLGITTTSGPGLSLKSEAIGLAVMTELPLVIVDVQRAGPSTGMPTKSEQSDLYQALFGRNGECPVVVMASASPVDCFYAAFEAAKIAMEHMTPVILLSDGYMGNGSQLFKIPKMSDLPAINPPLAKPNDPEFKPFKRDLGTLARQWALPGTEGLRHRVGGLEKENITGTVTTDPQNHQVMVDLRAAKVEKVSEYIDDVQLTGESTGDLLVVSWGGTQGAISSAVLEMISKGKKISHVHFRYIMPLPKNTANVFKGFKKIIVCELNSGQFVNYLRMVHPQFMYRQYNKVQGLPFLVSELSDLYYKTIEE